MALFRNKRWIALIAALLLCGGGTFAYLHGRSGKTAADAAMQTVVTAQKGELKSTVSGSSQFEPGETQNIMAPMDGTIKTMNLSRNQQVKQGDLKQNRDHFQQFGICGETTLCSNRSRSAAAGR